MGFFDEALKKAAPGGLLSKPMIIAAGALILAKWLGGSRSDKPAEPSSSGQGQSRSAPQGRPRSPADIMPPDLPQQTQRMPSPAPMPGQRGGQQGMPQHRDQGRGVRRQIN